MNVLTQTPGEVYQLPVDFAAATTRGRRWRKQVLPVGTVRYRGGVLDFSRPVLKRIVQNFKAGAFDRVPLVLADPENRHNESPHNYAGVVTDMTLTDRGLEVVAALNNLGVRVIKNVPWIGTSVRYFANYTRPHDGRSFGPVVRHVCLTGDPHVTAMAEGAFDLTGATYYEQRDEQRGADMDDYRDIARTLMDYPPGKRLAVLEHYRDEMPNDEYEQFKSGVTCAARELRAAGVQPSEARSVPGEAERLAPHEARNVSRTAERIAKASQAGHPAAQNMAALAANTPRTSAPQ